MTCLEVKSRVLEWTAKRPDVARRAVDQLLLSNEGANGLAMIMRLIGLEYAWQLFDFIGAENRSILEHQIRQSFDGLSSGSEDSASGPLVRVLECFEREALELRSPQDSPFWFISSWNQERLAQAIEGISGDELALLAHASDPEWIRRVMQLLDTSNRAALLLAINRVSRLPFVALENSAIRLAERMLTRVRENDQANETEVKAEVKAEEKETAPAPDSVLTEEFSPELQVWQELIRESLGDQLSPTTQALVSELERLQQEQASLESDWEWESLAGSGVKAGIGYSPSKLEN